MLIAHKDPRRHPRVAAHWLRRYLEERDDATIDEAAMVAACLAALGGDANERAAQTLHATAGYGALQKFALFPRIFRERPPFE